MKVKFTILYKNGKEDEIIQEIEDEGDEAALGMIQAIRSNFKGEAEGLITLGNETTHGYYIRLSDVSRVKVDIGKID